MSIPLPNGERTFNDPNGHPISGGKVYTYVPGTTNPTPTYQDEQLTVANPNPTTLDYAGRAVMWYPGLTRQVVYDMFGNLQWDQETGFSLENYQGDLGVSGNLTVGGSSTFNGPVTDNSSLTVNGPTNLGDGLNVAGGANISGGLNTDGINDSGNLGVGGNTNINGSLTVAGPSDLNGGTTTSSFHDTGNAQIDGDLAVGGNETVAGNLHVGGTITGGGGTGGNPLFPPGSGGDFIVSMQLLWGSFTTQVPPNPGQVDPTAYHPPYGILAGWYVIITTSQGRQFTFPLQPSNYPTLPFEADTFTPIEFPQNRYIVFQADPSVNGSSNWTIEVMPDGSWNNWTDNGGGGVAWSILASGSAGQANNNPNWPVGTGNPPYTPWPTYLTTGYPGGVFPGPGITDGGVNSTPT